MYKKLNLFMYLLSIVRFFKKLQQDMPYKAETFHKK